MFNRKLLIQSHFKAKNGQNHYFKQKIYGLLQTIQKSLLSTGNLKKLLLQSHF